MVNTKLISIVNCVSGNNTTNLLITTAENKENRAGFKNWGSEIICKYESHNAPMNIIPIPINTLIFAISFKLLIELANNNKVSSAKASVITS